MSWLISGQTLFFPCFIGHSARLNPRRLAWHLWVPTT
jgi:hypothetical protein